MSDILTNFHFIRPLWLLAIIPALGIFAALLGHHKRSTQWTTLVDQRLLPYLLDGKFTPAQKAPLYGLLTLWLVSIIALAGPTWEQKPQPIQKDVSALVILWDMSPSMYTQDIKPSRLARSRLKLRDLLDQRKEGLTALIAYSGEAHIVTPLTDDTRTIKSLLPGIDPSVMPSKGSNAEAALDLAIELLAETSISNGNIVFATDGIAPSALNTLSSSIRDTNHRVSVWGIGTAEGAPIPLNQGGFARNRNGDIVIAKVDDRELSNAAVKMGGVYIPFSTDNRDIESLLYFGLDSTKTENEENARVFDQWLEQGHWLVLFLLPFAALAFRRGWLICLLPLFVLAPESHAFSWQDLWQTKDQQAQQLLKDGDVQAAADTFKNQDKKAVAQYKSGDFENAAEQFAKTETAQGHYNHGNALTHQGKYDEAIAAFDKALALAPEFNKAKDNRSIAEKLKQLEEQQQQNNQQQDGQEGEQDPNQQNQQQDGQQGQNGQQQNGNNEQNNDQSGEQNQENANNEKQQGQQGEQDQNSQQNGEQGDQSQQNNQQASNGEPNKEEQQALEDTYKDAQQGEGEEKEQNAQQQAQLQQGEPGEQEGDEQNSQNVAIQQMTQEEKEQQQALEQWLRRVPDDPSGLLRNKFKYEYQQRRREMQSRSRRAPNSQQEERW